MELSHVDPTGQARMVDVAGKAVTRRQAEAESTVRMKPETLCLIRNNQLIKGDVLAVARVAGIMAAKETPDLIPLCHPLMISSVTVDFEFAGEDCLRICTQASTTGQTGVEMEALTAASVAALTVYDMCKAVDKGMTIENTCLLTKTGGKSGEYRRRTDG